jgi:hypothetical protein
VIRADWLDVYRLPLMFLKGSPTRGSFQPPQLAPTLHRRSPLWEANNGVMLQVLGGCDGWERGRGSPGSLIYSLIEVREESPSSLRVPPLSQNKHTPCARRNSERGPGARTE